jgi:hypothetical protein
MRRTVSHFSTGDNVEVLNGDMGWTLVPGHGLRPMSAAEVQAARMQADAGFISSVKKTFAEFRVRPDTEIAGHAATAVIARNPNAPPLRLYFDKQTGLLLRLVRYVDSPLGSNPTQIDYSDYRNVAGTMQPFRWTVAQPEGRYTVQLTEINVNVPLEDGKFATPEAPSASSVGGNH